MESRRFLLAIVLMVAVVVGTNLLFSPMPPARAPETVTATEPATDRAPERSQRAAEIEAGAPDAAPSPAITAAPVGEVDTLVVESPLYRYAFSTRGGSVVGAELLRFESFSDTGAVQLVPDDAESLISYRLRIGDRTIDLRTLPFEPETAGTVTLRSGEAPRTIGFRYADPTGAFTIRLGYTFDPDDYVIGVRGAVEGLASNTAPHLLVDLGPTLKVNEANPEEDYRALAYVVNGSRDGVASVPLKKVDEERIEEGPLYWVALKNKYFVAAVLNDAEAGGSSFGGLIAREVTGEYTADLTATLPVGSDGTFAFRSYLGPQEYDRLTALGQSFEDVNPYGWKVLRPIIRPLAHVITGALVGLHRALDLGYGWVLILFGVLVRVILWPLNTRAMRSQMKNMALQPRMQEIQAKYKNNPEKLQQEMIRLYREEGFNPLGGCLPMLIPFPVLITLFFVFQNTVEFRGVEFLWLPDLSRPDPLYILPLLLGASMFVMQRITAAVAPPNPQMKMMMYVMPAVMVVIFFNFASGLNLYYAAQNVASIPQQILLSRERKRHQQNQPRKEERRMGVR